MEEREKKRKAEEEESKRRLMERQQSFEQQKSSIEDWKRAKQVSHVTRPDEAKVRVPLMTVVHLGA